MRIAAVIVTFNRKALAIECLKGMLGQSRMPDHVFIIDNASTDDTPEVLSATGILGREDVTYFRTETNLGGAGGFHQGMKLAYEAGYDWIWIMDDDVEPLPSALERMLGFADISRCIQPGRMYAHGERVDWDQTFDPSTGIKSFHKDTRLKYRPWKEVDVGCFEGMLIAREIVDRIGLPDPRFFLVHDDSIYGFAASLHTPVIYLRDSLMLKKLRPNTLSPRFCFYAARNHFLVMEQLTALGAADRRGRLIVGACFLLSTLLAKSLVRGGLKPAIAVMRGILAGWQGKFGRSAIY